MRLFTLLFIVATVSAARPGTAGTERNDNVVNLAARSIKAKAADRRPFDPWPARYAATSAALDLIYGSVGFAIRPTIKRAFALEITSDHDTIAEIDAWLAGYARAIEFATLPLADQGLQKDLGGAHEFAEAAIRRRADDAGVESEIGAYRAAFAKLVGERNEGGFGLTPVAARERSLGLVTALDLAVPSEILDRLERERILTEAFGRTLAEGGLQIAPTAFDAALAAWMNKPASVREVMHLLDRYEIAVTAYLAKRRGDEVAIAREWALEVARRTKGTGETRAHLAAIGYFEPVRAPTTRSAPSRVRRALTACWRALTRR